MIRAIEITNLRKSYGTLTVLNDVSLHIGCNEVYGLLGLRGAGKSTLLHLLLGFLKPSEGSVRVLGLDDLVQARQRLGYVPEATNYHLHYSAREYLSFLGRFSDLHGSKLRRRVEQVLESTGLTEVANRRLATLTRALLQRLALAQALLNDPEVLLIDEPLVGLEHAEQSDLVELLADICTQGPTVLLCSQYTGALTRLCDRVGILAGGRIVDEVEIHQLRKVSTSVRIQVDHLPPGLRQQLGSIAAAVTSSDHVITLRPNSQQLQAQVLRRLLDHGVTILALEQLEQPLEQFYIQALQRTSFPPQPAETELAARLAASDGTAADASALAGAIEPATSGLLNQLLLGNQQPDPPPDRQPDDPPRH